jgi:8-oxo-dGTP pyrophosphatase MutT (NUDIX family)
VATERPRYTALARTLIFVFRNEQLLLMKYSGKGQHQTTEKTARKDIYNPIGGHVEANEDIIENARKEAQEEAGIELREPKIKGVINVTGFAGKNILVFVVVGTTKDEGVQSSLEGELHWVDPGKLDELSMFADVQPILQKLRTLKDDEMIVGKATFEGFELRNLQLNVA